MKTFLVVFGVGVLGVMCAQAVQVNGSAYLSGQSNHENIRVIFEAVSPSAETDTVYTNSEGAFAATLQPGVYNILYSHLDYANYNLPNQVLLWDRTLDPVTLLPPLSGYLSGTLGPGDFQVTDSIVVAVGQSLVIQPGTRLLFEFGKRFYVCGQLTAVGTELDSIVFTRRTPSPDSLWGGLLLDSAEDGTTLEHCVIEYAGGYAYAGIFVETCGPAIRHCSVRLNSVAASGIESISSSAHVENCSIAENQGTFGGIYCYGGAPTFAHCGIVGNSSQNNSGGVYTTNGSQAHFSDCLISQNLGESGGGVSTYSSAVFERCWISDNHSTSGAGGVWAASAPVFVECAIVGNESDIGAGGIRCSGGTFQRCTIAGNRASFHGYGGDAVLFSGSVASFSSCAFVGSGSNPALYFSDSHDSIVRYCNIFAGDSAAIGYSNDDPANGPLIIGVPIITNPNGDSCDTYYNIFLDPQFVDTANGDYHLQAGSPCIDAGDPELPPDPDGTVADIGAFYFDQLKADDPERTAVRHYTLEPAYPNPFNSTTQIVFDVPQAERAEIGVYDITGRLVRTLFSGPAATGRKRVAFAGDDLPSGLYFCRLTAGEFRQTRKLVLIK